MTKNTADENAALASRIDAFYNGGAFGKRAKLCDSADDILHYCIYAKAWNDAMQYERCVTNSKIVPNRDLITRKLENELKNNLLYIENDFDAWHREMCVDTSYGMRCGVWQKLINMSFKYIYCARVKKDMLAQFDGVFAHCHCPIDSKIAERILKLMNEADARYGLIKSVSISGATNWNNIDYAANENLTALEFDFVHWEK